MRYHRQLIKGIFISIIVLLITVAILSYLQANYIDNAWYAIFNNIAICILTGGLVALFQSIIGYRNAKRDSLLVYYKDLILLEYKIVHYQYEAIGFVDAPKGQKCVGKGLADKVAFAQTGCFHMQPSLTRSARAFCSPAG